MVSPDDDSSAELAFDELASVDSLLVVTLDVLVDELPSSPEVDVCPDAPPELVSPLWGAVEVEPELVIVGAVLAFDVEVCEALDVVLADEVEVLAVLDELLAPVELSVPDVVSVPPPGLSPCEHELKQKLTLVVSASNVSRGTTAVLIFIFQILAAFGSESSVTELRSAS